MEPAISLSKNKVDSLISLPGLNKLMIFTSTLINQIPIDETPTIATPVASIRFG